MIVFDVWKLNVDFKLVFQFEKYNRTANSAENSLISLHARCKRALPEQKMLYKHSVKVCKLYNNGLTAIEWLLSFQNFELQLKKLNTWLNLSLTAFSFSLIIYLSSNYIAHIAL